jgi:exonuclease SbcC
MIMQSVEIEKLFRTFGECQVMDGGLVRCNRLDPVGGKAAIATYWVDPRGDHPRTEEALRIYQKRLFSAGYYELPKNLQFNQYVIFLVDDANAGANDFESWREGIEGDASYARKFVFTPSQLREYVRRFSETFGPSSKLSGPTERWTKALDAVRLSEVYGEKPRAQVIRRIEDWEIGPAAIQDGVAGVNQVARPLQDAPREALPFIQRVNLTNVGRFPKDEFVEFAPVTLLYGENGAGKTTILEGIELAFCGANLRGERKVHGLAEATIEFVGGDGPKRFGTTSKDRVAKDLSWFGSYSRRDARLEDSFSRYVFFNADASYVLQHSENQKTVSESINRLALGEASNLMWGRLEEYQRELEKVKATRTNDFEAAHAKQRTIKKLADDLGAPTVTMEDVFQKAQKALRALKLKGSLNDPQQLSSQLLETVMRVRDLLSRLTASIAWIPDASINAVEARGRELRLQVEMLESASRKFKVLSGDLEVCKTELSKSEKRLAVLHRYQMYLRVKWQEVFEELRKLEKEESRDADLLKQKAELQVTAIDAIDKSKTLDVALTEIAIKREAAASAIQAAQRTVEVLQQAISEREQLAVQIKSLAKSFMHLDPHAANCPVCGTDFLPGELLAKTDEEIRKSTPYEAQVLAMQQAVQTQKKTYDDALLAEVSLKVLLKVAQILEFESKTATVDSVLSKYEGRLLVTESQTARINSLRSIVQGQVANGLSDSEYRNLRSEVSAEVQGRIEQMDDREIAARIKRINRDLDKKTTQKTGLEAEIANLSRVLDQTRALYQVPNVELTELVNYVKAVLDRALDAQRLYTELVIDVRILRDEPLQQYLLLASVASDRLREYLSSQEQEVRRKAELASLHANEEQARKAGEVAKRKLQGIRLALDAIVDIRRVHSLANVVGGFFDEHLSRINAIFRDVHSPSEFSEVIVRPDNFGDLRIQLRRNDDEVVEVNQISTGQRSALALSIFFTLNEKLSSGPSLILLDDPVVNVDDLNVLAFFDYLREIALTRKRQLIFATANERVASLFEQKFSFLQDEFRRHPITRGEDLPRNEGEVASA